MIKPRHFELLAVSIMPVGLVMLVWRIAFLLDGPATWIALAVVLPLGYALADLISGIAHWLADRFGTPATPVVGEMFILPFREHHTDPMGITHHDFVEVNGGNFTLLLPIVYGVALAGPASTGSWTAVLFTAGTLSFVLSVIATNQFHKWAHMEAPPRFARWLQRHRIILSKEHHALHHTEPFDSNYCITTGWMNGPLERLAVFVQAERLLGRQPDLPANPAS